MNKAPGQISDGWVEGELSMDEEGTRESLGVAGRDSGEKET